MATRKKKKQRTMQLMASAALLSATVAPYVISADELTTNQTDHTQESLQNEIEATQATADAASVSLENENTIDNGSEITSSAGNTTTELIDNGIVHSTTSQAIETITEVLEVPTLFNATQTAPTFEETHAITVNFKDETQTKASIMDDFIQDAATLGITADGEKYVQLTLEAANKGMIQALSVAGNDASLEVNADNTTTITVPVDALTTSEAAVHVVVPGVYDKTYTVYLHFPNIANEYTEPVAPTPPAFIAKHVEKNVNFQFTAGADFETGSSLDSYLKQFITETDLVIGEDGKPYADITFGGHSYAGTVLKVGSADGPDADIIASTGSAETKDLVRTVRVALNEDYQADIFFGSARGNYTFKFDLVEEETKFNFTSGTAQDAYFSAWVPRADVVETATGDKYAYITFAGHSYAVNSILIDGQAADIISTTGSAETKDLTRVVRVKLDASNKAAVSLDGGSRGAYTFSFDFTEQTETSFIDTLTANYQDAELEISAGMPAMFIVPAALKTVQAKKDGESMTFSIQTTKAESARGFYKTVSFKQNGQVIKSVSAESNEIAEFTVDSLEGLTIDVVYVTSSASTADSSIVEVNETTYTGTVTGANLVVTEITPPTPDTSAVNPSDYTTGTDLDEAVFTEQAKKVNFTFSSLKSDIPSAAALAVIVPEATIVKKNNQYEVTLQVNPVRTDRLFITQKGSEIASIDTKNGESTTLTFTVNNLDHLFFYVDGVSGAATGSIETVIGAQVTGYTLLDVTTLPTPDEVIDANAAFTFTTGNTTVDGYMKSLINKAQIVKVNGQLYADVTLTGNTYGYTHVKLNDYNGAAIAYATNGLTGKELVRVIRIPLNEEKKVTVAMFSDAKEDGTRTYDNVFAFDFNPPATDKVLVNTAADLKATDQALALEYSATDSSTSWHAAAFPSTVKAVSAKAVNGKVQVMLQVATDGLQSFTVAQNGQEIAKWVNTSSIVLFTVDALENVTFSANKTATQGTTTMKVNVKEASLNPDGALPVETIIIEPTTPPVTTDEGTAITYTMVADPNGEMADFITGYLNPYFSNAKLITRDGQKFVQLTLTGKAYGFTQLKYVKADGTKHNVTTISSTGEKLEQVRVVELPLIQDANGVSKVFVDSGELGYGAYTLFFKFNVDSIAAPTAPTNNSKAIITKPSDVKLETNKETSFNFIFGTSVVTELKTMVDILKSMLTEPKIKVNANKKFEVKFKITPKPGVKKIRIMQNGVQLGIWTAPTSVARVASLLPFFASNSNDISFEADTLENITFETVDAKDKVIEIGTKVEVEKTVVNETSSNSNTGTITGGGGATVKPPVVASDVENRESISYKMVADPNGPMADFMTNYMNPYFSNAELVTVGGKNYIELTLTGKAYGFQNLSVTGGYKVISSEGEKMEQVRVIRFPAAKDVKIHVDSGELGYGAYDLLFTFDLSEEQMKNAAAAGTGGITPVQTITPQIVSEGDVKFTIPASSSAIVTYAKKISSKLVDGKYNVSLTLMTETDLETFVVKQGDKEIARWDKKAKSASLANAANSNVLSFTVESLDNLTLIASTKNRTLEAKLLGEPAKKEEVQQVTKDGRTPMSYTMEADPAGPMADFISGYLAPYFSNAVYVLENGKEYVELTLTGKAYGFATLQYIDADGKNVDIEVLSSTGEKLDQVRVVRLPLVQDKDGITKIFVDSGDLGYGAYTLFFKFNVPAKSGETAKPAVTNPFKDIDGVYSKDDILALYAAGITTGTSETAYSPNANMTRAQFAVMVARTLGVSSTAETKFKDVQGKWYAKEVQALAEIGIITGVSETKFKPGDKITRQQAAVMIHRMLAHQGYTNIATVADLNFKDSAKISDYAKEAFAELQAQGIMTGYEGKVNPTKNLTRAQMAKILKNAADLVGLLD